MIEIMHDEVDIVARELVPHIINIANRQIDNLTYFDQQKA
jgi:hypothetical protein